MTKTTDELVADVLNGIGGDHKSLARWALHTLAARLHEAETECAELRVRLGGVDEQMNAMDEWPGA